MNEEMDVLERLNALCRERSLSYYELARRAGIPYSTLNTLLLKGTQPSLSTLRKLCGGLGITLQQFFTPTDTSALTPAQRECLSTFSILSPEEQSLALAYMKGLAHKL